MNAEIIETSTSDTLSGTVEHITYSNKSNGYTVAVLNAKDDEVTVVGTLPFISVGDFITVTGHFDNHRTYGPQFKVESLERSEPSGKGSVLCYLSSGAIRGVGPATAKNIVDRFGEDTLSIIETEPERLAEIRGISREKAEIIGAEYRKQFGIREVMMFLSPFNVSPEKALNVFNTLGSSAKEIISKNPYVLFCEDIGFSFEKTEEIASSFSVAKNDEYRIAAGIEYVLRHNISNGHTCIPRKKLVATASRLLECGADEVDGICEEMVKSLTVRKKVINETELIFLPKYFSAEEYVAARLAVLLKYSPPREIMADIEIDFIESSDHIKYEAQQRVAIKTALSCGITVLTGGPGTGKTTTLNAIIKILESKDCDISLAAPTGRAAKRMSELTGHKAKTIHRLLEVEWGDNDRPVFARNEKNPLKCDVLIIDEMSMVDILLFEALLRAVRLGCRIILVGDADQLPSVGAGNVFADIINSNVVPSVRLDKVFRQAMESLITQNAHLIIAGQPPHLDCKTSDFFMIQNTDRNSAADMVVDLCAKRLPEAYGFDPACDIQVLCPSKMFELGSVNLNNMLQFRLNPLKKNQNKLTFKGFELREGDKVMQIKNNYDITWTSDSGESGTGIFNGDIGSIEEIDLKNGIVKVKFDDRTAVYYSENIGELELSYAMTIHKSQGSEFECVILPLLDAPSKLLYRNLLYTAVTRAKKLLVVVGSRKVVMSMVNNNRKNLRYTSLRQLLEENFV